MLFQVCFTESNIAFVFPYEKITIHLYFIENNVTIREEYFEIFVQYHILLLCVC
jgi:hypothetical protein